MYLQIGGCLDGDSSYWDSSLRHARIRNGDVRKFIRFEGPVLVSFNNDPGS